MKNSSMGIVSSEDLLRGCGSALASEDRDGTKSFGVSTIMTTPSSLSSSSRIFVLSGQTIFPEVRSERASNLITRRFSFAEVAEAVDLN
jgi:hypothetical protein